VLAGERHEPDHTDKDGKPERYHGASAPAQLVAQHDLVEPHFGHFMSHCETAQLFFARETKAERATFAAC
jgi:hypothetical protein